MNCLLLLVLLLCAFTPRMCAAYNIVLIMADDLDSELDGMVSKEFFFNYFHRKVKKPCSLPQSVTFDHFVTG